MKTALLLAALCGISAAQALVEGRPGSKVRVLIYEDLQCSDCADFRVMLDRRILPRYGERVEFVHRDFPLPKHAWARRAAIASRFFASKDLKLALAYRQHTLATLRETTPANFEERLAAFAKQHGVDPNEAVRALGDAQYAALVEKDFQEGVARGVSRTPTVFIDGTPYVERFTFDEIAKGLDAALAQAN
jgi:protein-disulfide isomerase